MKAKLLVFEIFYTDCDLPYTRYDALPVLNILISVKSFLASEFSVFERVLKHKIRLARVVRSLND